MWEDCVVKIISSALRRGTKDLQNELLNAIANADNVKLVDKVIIVSVLWYSLTLALDIEMHRGRYDHFLS